jgi:hypothetical protein
MAAAVGGSQAVSTARAAWRNPARQAVQWVDAATMCWWPRRPGYLRAANDDFASILPCQQCPGCLERQRRLLAARLAAHYQNYAGDLYFARIRAPAAVHARLSRHLHRRRQFELDPGFFRVGTQAFGVLGRDRAELETACRTLGRPFRIWKLRLKRGRAAWRIVTAGLLVERAVYGEQVNRWYVRQLPPGEKLRWEIQRIPYERGYDRRRSPRAWRTSDLILVPPAAWTLHKHDSRTVRKMLAHASSPEGVGAVMTLVKSTASALVFPSNQPTAPKLSREVTRDWYREHAARVQARDDAARAATTDLIDPPSEGGRYSSSDHAPPRAPPAASEHQRWLQAQRDKDEAFKRENLKIFEAFARKGRGTPTDGSK